MRMACGDVGNALVNEWRSRDNALCVCAPSGGGVVRTVEGVGGRSSNSCLDE